MHRHTKHAHKNMATRASKPAMAHDHETYRVVDPNPKGTLDIEAGELWVPTGPTVVHKAYSLVAMTPMGPPEKSISIRAGASKSVSSSSKRVSSSTTTSKPVASTSALAAGPFTARSVSVSSKRKAEEPAPGPSKIRRVDNARSVSASVSTSKATAGPSKTITHIAAPKPLFMSAPLKTNASAFMSSGLGSTSKKRAADVSTSEPSSSKVRRVSGWTTYAERQAPRAAMSTSDTAPARAPGPGARPIALTKETGKKARPVGNAPSAPAPVPATASKAPVPTPVAAPTLAKGPPKPRPIVRPGSLAKAKTQTQTTTAAPNTTPVPKKKRTRPALAAGVAASSASSRYSTSTRSSSSSLSSARSTPTPTPASARYAPRGSRSNAGASMGTKCRDCGGWLDAYGQDGMCAMCYVESLPAAPAPAPVPVRCATCGDEVAAKDKETGRGNECAACYLRARFLGRLKNAGTTTADAAPVASSKATGGQGGQTQTQKPTTRKKRVTKQMRRREFERWFAQWTAARRARRPAGAQEEEEEEEEGGEEEEEDKTNWWRVESTRKQGGVCYSTPEAFFAALEDALRRHREAAAKGKGKGNDKGKGEAGAGGVLTFFGGYSIVAQPKISAMARLDRLVARMEEMGFRLDSAAQGYVKFQYKSARGTMDEVYKYPCTCGGTPPPIVENETRHAHRMPDAKYAGEVCGGTVMLMVGEDNARLAYGIRGQRIAVDIVH